MPENKKSIQEFAQSIKAKYPDYKDVDDVELANKFVEKYPEYKNSVEFEVKKKTLSTDSTEVGKPLSKSGETTDVAKSVESITSKFTKPLPTAESVGDYDAYKSTAINSLKNTQKQIKERSIYGTPQQGVVEGGINVLPSTREQPQIDLTTKELYDKKSLTLENARKAFKVNYVEENPAIAKKLESEDEAEVEAANKEIYKAWVKEPEILSGTERGREARSWVEETYDSFKEGLDEREFNKLMAEQLSYATPSEAKQILELEYNRAISQAQDIQAPQDELTSFQGITKMAGTQAVPIVTTIALSAIPGVGKPASIIYSSADAGATSYGAAFRSAYIQARSQGMEQDKAYDIARKQSKVEFTTGAVEGALGATTGRWAQVGGKYTSRFGSKLLKPLIDKAATGTLDLGLDAAAAGTGQIVNNWAAMSKGLDVNLFDGVQDEMLGEVIFSGAMKIPSSITTVSQFKKYVKDLPPQDQQKVFDDILDNKDNIERKVLNDRTNDYLNLKGQEAIDNPVESLNKDLSRLTKIENALVDKTAKEEVQKNIDALKLMIENVEQRVVIKDGDTESIIGSKDLLERIKDPEFVAKVANGELDIRIDNNEQAANKLNDAITKYKENVSKDKTRVSSKEQVGKEPIEAESKQGDGAVETKGGGVLQTQEEVVTPKEKPTPEAKKNFAIDAVIHGQILPRSEAGSITNAREDFGMPSKQINAAIQNIKDVAEGKKQKYSKPAEQLIEKLGEYYEQGDIPVIEGTGGTTVRERGIPISEMMKGIEESKKGLEQKAKIDDSDLDAQMKDWLNEDDDWAGADILNHANVSDKIIEWTGDKMPEKDIKGAIKTLRNNIESGVNKKEAITNSLEEMQSTDWYKDLDENKQKAFDYDFRKALGDDMKASQKVKIPTEERVFVRKDERVLLKEKIKNLATGAKIGAKEAKTSIANLQGEINEYMNNSLKEFPVTKAVQEQLRNMVKNTNDQKSLERALEKVDKIYETHAEADRKQTIRDIKNLVGSKKSILKKVNDKWVGKVPINVQEYIKNFDTDNLNSLTRAEAKNMKSLIEDVLAEGTKEIKALEKARRYQKKKEQGRAFSALRKGGGKTVNNKEEILAEFDNNKNQALLLDGHLITSKSALENYLKDFPDTSLEGVVIYKTKTPKIQADTKNRTVMDFIRDIKNPIAAAQNLMNNALALAKIGKEGLKIAREIANEGMANEVEYNTESSKLTKTHINAINDIFLKHKKFKGIINSTYAAKRLKALSTLTAEDTAKIQDGIGERIVLTNDRLVNWYNINKTPDGAESLKRMGVDMDIVNKYVENTPDLKEFADYLIDKFYVSLKDRYEPTYIHLTGQKFNEGIYYPTYKVSPISDISALDDIVNETGGVESIKSIAGSLNQKINNTADIDLTKGAFDVSTDYINTMERSKIFIPYAEKIDAIFNKQTVPEIIDQIGYDKYRDLIDHVSTVIKGVSPRKGSKMDSKFINAAMKVKIFASLAGKFASVPKQLTSFARFMHTDDVPIAEFIKGAPINKNEADVVSRIMSSEYVVDRFNGMSYDLEAQRLTDAGSLAKSSEALKKGSKILMSPVSVGDIGGVLMGGIPYSIAAYRQEIAKGLSHEQAYQNAYKRFVDISEKTQQSSLKSQVSHLQRSDYGRLFSLYSTSQKQGINQMITAVKELRYDKDLTKAQKAKRVHRILFYATENMIFAAVANGFIQNLYNELAGEEDDDEFNKGLYQTMSDNVQSLLSGTGYTGYLLNMAINQLQDNTWKNELPIYQEIENLSIGAALMMSMMMEGKTWDDLSDKEKNDFIRTIPIDGIVRQARDFIKAHEGEKSLLEAVMGWKSAEEKKGFKPKDDKVYRFVFDKPYFYDDLSDREKLEYDKEHSPEALQRKKQKEERNKQKEKLISNN